MPDLILINLGQIFIVETVNSNKFKQEEMESVYFTKKMKNNKFRLKIMRFLSYEIHSNFLYFILFSFLFSICLYSQESSKAVIRWKPEANAVSYQLEIKPIDKLGKKIHIETRKEEVSLDLNPGDYQYRVGSVNKFKKVNNWTEWLNLEVVLSVPPIVDEDSRYSFFIPEKEQNIIVKGKNFLEAIKIELEFGLETIPINDFRRISKTEIQFSVNLEQFLNPEKIRIILINPLGKITTVESFIVLKKKPAPKLPSIAEVKKIEDPKPLPEEPKKEDPPANLVKTDRGYTGSILPPLWRSAVIPGWGQVYKGENNKGYMLGGSAFLFLGSSLIFRETKNHSLERSRKFSEVLFVLPGNNFLIPSALYLRSQSIASRNKAEQELQKQNAVLGMAAAIYLYNVFDILWNQNSSNEAAFAEELNSGFYLNTGHEGKGSFQFGYSFRY